MTTRKPRNAGSITPAGYRGPGRPGSTASQGVGEIEGSGPEPRRANDSRVWLAAAEGGNVATEYRFLSIPIDTSQTAIDNSQTERVGGVEVTLRPKVDAVVKAMGQDNWVVDAMTVDGSYAWLLFRRTIG
jgi:hypothetical protein